MTICKTRVEPFDVLIKKRMANTKSVDCAFHLVEEFQVEWGNVWPTNDLGAIARKKTVIMENSSLKQF